MGPLTERTPQVMWVLDYLDDLDADFLAFYGIDLNEAELSGPRFFALANRLTAYSGVMSARVEAEREKDEDGTTPAPTRQAAAESSTSKEVGLTAFRVMFPGIVSSTEA